MKLLYVTSEAYPFCKTGGLADVAGSLPPALAAEGVETAVILPLYDKIGPQWREKMPRCLPVWSWVRWSACCSSCWCCLRRLPARLP